METINLGILKNGPHAKLIRGLAEKCFADSTVEALWVGGSLATGTGDIYSDIDFRIAVDASQLKNWHKPDWDRYLPLPSCGGSFMQFGEQALLHHLVLSDGTIIDFYIQDTLRKNPEPNLVVIACRNETFGEALAEFSSAPRSLVGDIKAEVVRQLFIDYWITTHKELKGLGRKYDYASFVGLYFERVALLRAWHMEIVGKDIDARVSIHMLGALHKGFDGKLSTQQQDLIGMPTRTPEETVLAVEAIRVEMSRLGQVLSKTYEFQYPQELENVVLKTWKANKQTAIER